MTQSQIDIDRMVREVLAALADKGLAPRAENVSSEPAAESSPDALVLTTRVVTLSQLHGKLEAIRRLVVPNRAVITPAVRDELRQRSITVEFASESTSTANCCLRLVLAVSDSGVSLKPLAGGLVESLSGGDVEVVPKDFDCAIRAVEQLAGELRTANTLGLLITRHVAAALCLANRHAGVRAITATDAKSVARNAAAVGANLLLLDPEGGNTFRLRQAAAEFCRGGVQECPENLREKLA